ncbi:MAG: GNAT family N-acetyltransferase [Bacteroidetes bacterium]|nr:GNAT family N-acetyltransferase [Bacteroidota bacterium]
MFHISEVSQTNEEAFISLPYLLYKDDPNFIAPLETETRKIFNPATNSFFNHGSCTRWILYQENKPIGRIAAFVNNEKANNSGTPTGGIGFFECINNQDAANLLFTTAIQWLQQKGMKAMEGPINFGENDNWWGLLIQGFRPPAMGMNYNQPYYQQLFEHFGWQKSYDQLTNVIDLHIPFPERFEKIAQWVVKKPGYQFKHFNKRDFKIFSEDFKDVYNDAWQNFEGFAPITSASIADAFVRMKPIMDEKIIWFAYYNNEPIAFVVCLPDTNQILKHVNGKLNLWGKLKYLWYSKTKTIDRIRIIVMGVKTQFQNKGIESALILMLKQEVVPRNTIKEVELAWVGDFNDKMMAIHEATGAKLEKIHRTYKYQIEH